MGKVEGIGNTYTSVSGSKMTTEGKGMREQVCIYIRVNNHMTEVMIIVVRGQILLTIITVTSYAANISSQWYTFPSC